MKLIKHLLITITFFILVIPSVKSQSLEDVLKETIKAIEGASTPEKFNITLGKLKLNKSYDATSQSDCYYEIYLGKRLIYKSETIHDNNAPVFNSMHTITKYSVKEKLILVFKDKDMTKSDNIGYVYFDKLKSGNYKVLSFNSNSNISNSVGDIEVTFEY